MNGEDVYIYTVARIAFNLRNTSLRKLAILSVDHFDSTLNWLVFQANTSTPPLIGSAIY
jgi:hypothetical protein